MLYLNILLSSGLLLALIGSIINEKPPPGKTGALPGVTPGGRLAGLDAFLSKTPFAHMKNKMRSKLSLFYFDEAKLNKMAFALSLAFVPCVVLIFALFMRLASLWYVRVATGICSFVIPFYALNLWLEVLKYRMNRRVPAFIDEFRGVFVKNRKILPSIRESSLQTGGELGALMLRASESSQFEKKLENIAYNLDNCWLNVFIKLIINYKQNGGELTDQLYRLNRSITRYVNIEKKKGRRLIWYEAFIIASCLIGLPGALLINRLLLGGGHISLYDPQVNMIVFRIFVFSMASLMVIRVLKNA